jgi:predicted ATPase with chaperone activity
VVITGGELTMEMLDLSYDPVSKYYDAPASNKATGGVFIIDDFGRQRVPAGDLLNRWILPLERGIDFMTLRTGKKLRMPFDQLVIFSTNFEPTDLMDAAALRRVQYKLHLPSPTPEAYEEIFRRVCTAHGLELPQAVLDYLMDVFYPETGTPPSAYHPRFIVEHVIASCDFEKVPTRLTVELARDALKNLVVTEVPESREVA